MTEKLYLVGIALLIGCPLIAFFAWASEIVLAKGISWWAAGMLIGAIVILIGMFSETQGIGGEE